MIKVNIFPELWEERDVVEFIIQRECGLTSLKGRVKCVTDHLNPEQVWSSGAHLQDSRTWTGPR